MLITSQLVKDFYAAALEHFAARVVDKHDSDFMALVGKFLDGIGVVDHATFMSRFVTTIGTSIYVPFDLGVEQDGWDLQDQLSILPHELTHCRQYRAAPAAFMVNYLVCPDDRAAYEAEAYAADLEMALYLDPGAQPDVQAKANLLLNYGLKQRHCDFAAQCLAVHLDVLQQGGTVNPVALWAKHWLGEHAAH